MFYIYLLSGLIPSNCNFPAFDYPLSVITIANAIIIATVPVGACCVMALSCLLKFSFHLWRCCRREYQVDIKFIQLKKYLGSRIPSTRYSPRELSSIFVTSRTLTGMQSCKLRRFPVTIRTTTRPRQAPQVVTTWNLLQGPGKLRETICRRSSSKLGILYYLKCLAFFFV